jgi:hypothetical protein
MATCSSCNSQATRILTTMTANGKLLEHPQDQCPNCCPELFQEAFAAPSDRKLWLEHEAVPDLYTRLPDGSLVAKDSVLCGIQAAMDMDPDGEAREQAIAKKRATRRTKPLTRTEIEQADRAWRPIVKERYAVQEKLERDDLLYTEAVVDRLVRIGREESIH